MYLFKSAPYRCINKIYYYNENIFKQLLEITFITTDIEQHDECSWDALQLNVGSEVVSIKS